MNSLLKSTVLGVGLLAGIAATAQAQSISALPPNSPPAAPAAATPPASSAKIYPSPGNAAAWGEPHYQPTEADKDPARHPYTMPHFGPAPN